MGIAYRSFNFGLLSPGESPVLYIHGFDTKEFTTFDLEVGKSPSIPGAFHASVSLEVEAVDLHVDGTKAYNITVHNLSTGNSAPKPFVNLLAYAERLS